MGVGLLPLFDLFFLNSFYFLARLDLRFGDRGAAARICVAFTREKAGGSNSEVGDWCKSGRQLKKGEKKEDKAVHGFGYSEIMQI